MSHKNRPYISNYLDSKPENILMDESGHVCLTDFGLSKKLDPSTPFATTFVGTPNYIGKMPNHIILSD